MTSPAMAMWSGCWALDPSVFRVYQSHALRAWRGTVGMPEALTPGRSARTRALSTSPSLAPGRFGRAGGGAIAVVWVAGLLEQHAATFGRSQGTSTDAVGVALRSAMADETVSQVLLVFDSPGGSVFGIAELAAEIREARAVKSIIGVANSTAAGAAYWLASACSELYCTPGGQVGSIGLLAVHQDLSKALEAEGVAVTLVSAGKYKAEGNAYGPLGRDATAAIQGELDGYLADFTTAVAKGRGVPVDRVRRDMGQGRMLRGAAAQAAGMVDGVATVDQVIKRMQRSQAARGPGATRPSLESRRHAYMPGTPRIEAARQLLDRLAAGGAR